MRLVLLVIALLVVTSCGGSSTVASTPSRPAAPVATPTPPPCSLALAESWPLETSLDHPDIADARTVWPEMIGRARRSIDVAEFYVSASGEGALEPTLRALREAAARGVRVRVLLDSKLAESYAASIERVRSMPGVEVVVWDAEAQLGGVHHAKYMVLDREQLFVGSQNLDDRSLEHIEELGIGGVCPPLAQSLAALFDGDWRLAQGGPDKSLAGASTPWARAVALSGGGAATLTASPRGSIPADAAWDIDALVGMADRARSDIDVQMLTFKPRYRDGSPFPVLRDALVRAASRGVHVRLLVSDWMKKDRDKADLRDIAAAGIEVRVIHIPPWSGGEVPFGRVAHAKYTVVDGSEAWIGTSNGEGDYFTKGRNVGVVVQGGPIPARVRRWFDDGWRMAIP